PGFARLHRHSGPAAWRGAAGRSNDDEAEHAEAPRQGQRAIRAPGVVVVRLRVRSAWLVPRPRRPLAARASRGDRRRPGRAAAATAATPATQVRTFAIRIAIRKAGRSYDREQYKRHPGHAATTVADAGD